MSETTESGICKICPRSGKLTSLLQMEVHVEEGVECQFKDLGNKKSCKDFEQEYDISGSILARLIL